MCSTDRPSHCLVPRPQPRLCCATQVTRLIVFCWLGTTKKSLNGHQTLFLVRGGGVWAQDYRISSQGWSLCGQCYSVTTCYVMATGKLWKSPSGGLYLCKSHWILSIQLAWKTYLRHQHYSILEGLRFHHSTGWWLESKHRRLMTIKLPEYPWQVLGTYLFQLKGNHYLMKLLDWQLHPHKSTENDFLEYLKYYVATMVHNTVKNRVLCYTPGALRHHSY